MSGEFVDGIDSRLEGPASDASTRTSSRNPCLRICLSVAGDAAYKLAPAYMHTAGGHDGPRSWGVHQRKRNTRQAPRAREADELAVHALREGTLNAGVVPRVARRGRAQRLELGVQCLSIETVLQREGSTPVVCRARLSSEREGEDGEDSSGGRHDSGVVEEQWGDGEQA